MKRTVFLTMMLIPIFKVYGEEHDELRYRSMALSFNYDELRLSNQERIMPVYTELKYYISTEGIYSPFIKSELGFNYVEEGEDRDEIENMFENWYYGIGMGVNIMGVVMEMVFANYSVVYKENAGEVSENRMLLKVKYRY